MLNRKLKFKKDILDIGDAMILFEKLNQPFKVELLKDIKEKGTTKLNPEEIEAFDGKPEITIYRIVDEKTGAVLFTDLCRGPHVDDVSELKGLGFKLDKFSGAYWRGDQKRNINMQRLYSLVFDSKDELKKYQQQRFGNFYNI